MNREAAPRSGDAADRIDNATGIAAAGTRGLRLLTLRMVALVEFIKGALVLVAGAGLLVLMHRQDLQDLAEALIRHLHLNPANEAPRIFLDLAGRLDRGQPVAARARRGNRMRSCGSPRATGCGAIASGPSGSARCRD